MDQAVWQQIQEIQGMLNAHKQSWLTLEKSEIEQLVRKVIELQAVLYQS